MQMQKHPPVGTFVCANLWWWCIRLMVSSVQVCQKVLAVFELKNDSNSYSGMSYEIKRQIKVNFYEWNSAKSDDLA